MNKCSGGIYSICLRCGDPFINIHQHPIERREHIHLYGFGGVVLWDQLSPSL